MKPLFALALGLAVLAPRFVPAEEKKDDYAAKIVGTWELVKSDDPNAPAGAVVTFAKDGKLKLEVTVNGMDHKFEGIYKVDKDKLETEMKLGEMTMKETETITKLTDSELETVDKDKKVTTFKKKK
jgi:uncharacterized protein (TIGR03066 family)